MNGPPRRGIGKPPPSEPTTARGHAPSSSSSAPSRSSRPASVSRAGTSAKAVAPRAPKKARKARDVADAFARGSVTLASALGMTAAEKDVLKRRAFALVQESKATQAIPLLEGLVALDPFDAWVLLALGGLLVDKGDHAVAETLLTRALAVTPGDPSAHAMRAEARAKQGNAQGARDDLKAISGADLSIPAVRRAKALETALSKL